MVEPRLAEHLAGVDPWAPAAFAVSWAGDDRSPGWFDVARELTERWLHQHQIRLAVGAPPLDDPELSAAVFDTFLRALPHTFARRKAPAGTALLFEIRGARTYAYTLARVDNAWHLLAGAAVEPAARVSLDEQTAWLLLTKGISGAEALSRASLAATSRCSNVLRHHRGDGLGLPRERISAMPRLVPDRSSRGAGNKPKLIEEFRRRPQHRRPTSASRVCARPAGRSPPAPRLPRDHRRPARPRARRHEAAR